MLLHAFFGMIFRVVTYWSVSRFDFLCSLFFTIPVFYFQGFYMFLSAICELVYISWCSFRYVPVFSLNDPFLFTCV